MGYGQSMKGVIDDGMWKQATKQSSIIFQTYSHSCSVALRNNFLVLDLLINNE